MIISLRRLLSTRTQKNLVEFRDKLKVASLECYAHIHADGEATEDSWKRTSLIGILMKDYSAGTVIKR